MAAAAEITPTAAEGGPSLLPTTPSGEIDVGPALVLICTHVYDYMPSATYSIMLYIDLIMLLEPLPDARLADACFNAQDSIDCAVLAQAA